MSVTHDASSPAAGCTFAGRTSLDLLHTRALQQRAHQLIPGGCHTYAKGDDQYPLISPGFIARGKGCHIWDVDGNEYIEYNMGGRAVTLGHAYPSVCEAARQAIQLGANFTRPAEIEVRCAEMFLSAIEGAEMVKFTKDGSTATSAAMKLARAATGRDMVAFCVDHPFFSYDDWFIGLTPCDAGIPQTIKDLSATFNYNDIASVEAIFDQHHGRIAAVIMEPAKYEDPQDDFLHKVRDLCHRKGAVFVLDEMITGFRWDVGGAQKTYDIVPDLSTFGKALANGFALSALCGKRDLMDLGGIHHDKERVFLLSTTHGAETHAMAAGIETIRIHKEEPVTETLRRQGERLAIGGRQVIRDLGLEDFVQIEGKPCNLVFVCRDPNGKPSQGFRSLFIQEMAKRGVFGPSFVVSYSHSDADIDHTVNAMHETLKVYQQALADGYEDYLVGRPSKVVYRKFN
jgi:glutamate-1-semialdehyde 2,1-aminomutase